MWRSKLRWLSRVTPRSFMWFARGTERATSMEVRLLSDLSRGLVPKQIASVLVGFRTRPLWRNQLWREEIHRWILQRLLERDAGEIKMCIVSILLLIDTVKGNKWSNRWDIDCEKNMTQDRALWNTTRWRYNRGGSWARGDWKWPIREIRLEPIVGRSHDAKTWSETISSLVERRSWRSRLNWN